MNLAVYEVYPALSPQLVDIFFASPLAISSVTDPPLDLSHPPQLAHLSAPSSSSTPSTLLVSGPIIESLQKRVETLERELLDEQIRQESLASRVKEVEASAQKAEQAVGLLHSSQPALGKNPFSTQPRLPRVVVFGLQGNQLHEVEKAFKKVARIIAGSRDGNRHNYPQGEHVILMTKFISHALQNVVFGKYGRDCVHLHHGGVDTLIDQITKFVKQ